MSDNGLETEKKVDQEVEPKQEEEKTVQKSKSATRTKASKTSTLGRNNAIHDYAFMTQQQSKSSTKTKKDEIPSLEVLEAQYRQEYELLTEKKAKFFECKKRRKELDRDSQLLANRIALLKQEEVKTWKKIDETREKTKEILANKIRNDDKHRVRRLEQKKKEDLTKMMASKNLDVKHLKQKDKGKIAQAIYGSKNADVTLAKAKKQENLQKLKYQEMRGQQENILRQHIVNQQKIIGKVIIEEEREKHMGLAQKINKEKQEEEEIIKAIKKQEVKEMEKLEMELINKLNNTVALQKQAYDDLEKALNQPSTTMSTYLQKANNLMTPKKQAV